MQVTSCLHHSGPAALRENTSKFFCLSLQFLRFDKENQRQRRTTAGMDPPPAKRQRREKMAETSNSAESEKPKKPTQFLDLPAEITQKIMHKLLSIQANRVDSRALITQTGEDLTYGDSNIPYYDADRPDTQQPRINHCRLKGLAIIATCSRLREEGSEVLLQQNRFVAVRGYVQPVTKWLDEYGIKGHWVPQWGSKWDQQSRCWIVDKTVFRPEILINFPKCDASETGPALVAIEDLEPLILALTISLYTCEDSWTVDSQVELVLKAVPKLPRSVKGFGNVFFDISCDKVLFWIGRWVVKISIGHLQGEPRVRQQH